MTLPVVSHIPTFMRKWLPLLSAHPFGHTIFNELFLAGPGGKERVCAGARAARHSPLPLATINREKNISSFRLCSVLSPGGKGVANITAEPVRPSHLAFGV